MGKGKGKALVAGFLEQVLGKIDDMLLSPHPNTEALKRWLFFLQDQAYRMEEVLQMFSSNHVEPMETSLTEKELVLETEFLKCAWDLKLLLSLTEQLVVRHKSSKDELLNLKHKSLESMTWQELLSLADKEGVVHEPTRKLPPPYSMEFTDRVHGREKEKNQIFEFLLSGSDDGYTDTRVLAIVGAGGTGKTTLANAVYKDRRVGLSFKRRVWVTFPSYELDAQTLAKIMLGIFKVGFHPDDTLQELVASLQKCLSGRRLLLVLDGCRVVREWETILRALFESAAKGSAVILTTRTTEAALDMLADHVLHLSFLSAEHCWSLFSDHCFGNARLSCHPELEAVGKRILKKCGGVPLAAKMLGGLLHKQDYKVWVEIWRSKQWDSTDENLPTPFVRLCYLDLPAQLRRCITYLSLFPKV